MSGVPRSALLVAQTNYADSRRPLAAAGKVSAAVCELARCCTEHPWPCALSMSTQSNPEVARVEISSADIHQARVLV